jgi:hypothetical protein
VHEVVIVLLPMSDSNILRPTFNEHTAQRAPLSVSTLEDISALISQIPALSPFIPGDEIIIPTGVWNAASRGQRRFFQRLCRVYALTYRDDRYASQTFIRRGSS